MTKPTQAESLAALQSSVAELSSKYDKVSAMESSFEEMSAMIKQMNGALKEVQIATARRDKEPMQSLSASPSSAPPKMPAMTNPSVLRPASNPLQMPMSLSSSIPMLPATANPLQLPMSFSLSLPMLSASTNHFQMLMPMMSTLPMLQWPVTSMEQTVRQPPSVGIISLYIPSDANPTVTNRLPHIDIPMFSGEGVKGWLFQVDRFFTHYLIPMEHRLGMVAFYLSGDALTWLQWMASTHQLSDWPSFVRDVISRFGPSTYWNAEIELNKLQQTGSVASYISDFEGLSVRTPGLSATNLLNHFLAGLKEEVHREILLLRPASLQLAMEMAKVAEQKLSASRT